MSNLKVLVVGASVAGPTTAYWLAKAGVNVTVIERFPKLRPGGQNIDIRTAGVTVMRKMTGLEAAVRAKLYDVEGVSFVTANGRRIATLRATGNPDQQSLISEYEILRGDLAQILYDMTKDNERIEYIFGEQVASMQHKNGSDGPITVDFANGSPSSEYDLVIACDGSTSRTRGIGLNCGVRDHIKPLNSWVAYFSTSSDLLNGSKIAQGRSAPGGRTVTLGPDSSARNRAMLWANLPPNVENATLPFQHAQKESTEALKQYVAQHFRGVGWKTDAILSDIMEAKDFYASEIVQVKVPALYKGRFALVGDAGYGPGPTGGGTSLAMAGAYILAGEVCRHGADIGAALSAYEERMQPIVKDLQKIPPGVPAVMGPQTTWGIWIRNTIFVLVAWGMNTFGGYFGWLTSFWGSALGADKYGLPDYVWAVKDEE